MGRWEWAILMIGFVALLVVELISVRRATRRARDSKPPRE